VLVSGCQPIRAKKARYYEDAELKARILQPPELSSHDLNTPRAETDPNDAHGDWEGAVIVRPHQADTEDPANGGIRREPELPEHEDIAPPAPRAVNEFEPLEEDADDEPQRQRTLQRTMSAVARQVSLDPTDEMQM
jgi:type IV secretion system protein VirD4